MQNEYKKNGFSLVEVLVALLVISISFAPIFDLMITTLRVNKFSYERLVAKNFALELLEQVVSFPYLDIEELDKYPINNVPSEMLLIAERNSTLLSLSRMPEGFHRTLSVSQVTESLKMVSVDVSWGNTTNNLVEYKLFTGHRP